MYKSNVFKTKEEESKRESKKERSKNFFKDIEDESKQIKLLKGMKCHIKLKQLRKKIQLHNQKQVNEVLKICLVIF